MNIDPANSHSADRLDILQNRARGTVGANGQTPADSTTNAGPNTERFQPSEEVLRQRALVKQLLAEPEIRPEVVSQGKALLEDTDFPSDADVDRLARSLLATLTEEG